MVLWAALREIEFDRATGKLSDADYSDLKGRYTKAALAELRAADARPGAVAIAEPIDPAISPAEAAIRRARLNQKHCVECGPRPEADALYCSNCSRYLPGACSKCGGNVSMPASRFCSDCGEHLAAA